MSASAWPPRGPHAKVHASGERGAPTTLGHGMFFGRFQTEVEVKGFALARVAADPDRDVQRHTHDTAHFIFVTRGMYATSAAGAPGICRSPTLIYNPPGTTHRDRFRPREDGGFDGAFFSISVAPERMRSIVDTVPLAEHPTIVRTPQAKAVAARLADELRHWDDASPLVTEGLCLELMGCVARRGTAAERTPPRWLSTAKELLRTGDALCSVGGIAVTCGVHPVHLARAFRNYFGCSPGAYLRRCRVVRAAALLRRRDLPLAEVALLSGFADQSHMTHAMRRALGVTPAAYRRAGNAPEFDSCKGASSAQDDPHD